MKRKPRKTVMCGCACGTPLETPDSEGRQRRYISGHNRRKYYGKEATRWARSKRWKSRHPEVVRNAKRKFYRTRKLKAMRFLGNACFFCPKKYNGKNAAIFEFHHRKPKYKYKSITRMLTNASWPVIKKELKKCVLACANCHNQHHGGEW